MDIALWLRNMGLDRYASAFRNNDIDPEMLPQLTAEDLAALGVLSVGHRRKLLSAIAALREGPANEPQSGPPVAAELARSRAERRQLTVMFVDLVGSTELSQQLDPEEMREVILAYQSAVSSEITRYEGQVAKLMGDGVLAYFGWPQAHEDDAERAVHAGLAAAASTASLRALKDRPLSARVGIATGLVVVGDLVGEGSAQEEAVVGETPNLAARLQALAEPNSVVVAESTHRLVAGLFDVADLGRRELKGFAAPVRAWRIVGEAGVESRFDARRSIAAPLVGRAEELELLLDGWRRVCAGEGQAVLLSGEAGIGKSRLIAALDEGLEAAPHARLRYFCSNYHVNSALHPIIQQIERAAGLVRDDSTSTKLDKLDALLLQAVADTGELGPFLAALLSIDSAGRFPPLKLSPQAQKAGTFSALFRQIGGLAARQPVMMLFEDAHWIDPTTAEWLDQLVDRLRDLPVFLIVTVRPEFQPHWSRFPHVTALSLSRLGQEQGGAIADRVAGGKALPPEIRNQILAKTEGVPLFVEELTKTVIESGLLVDAGDRYELSGPLPSLAIPSTLQDSLMARLDRLSSAKEVAQIGACIGRVFDRRLLAAVTGYEGARLDGDLQRLERSELIFRRGVAPEATYAFKHALVQDTAYQSLLKSRRQQIHAIIASTLEAQFPETAEAEPETLAHHYTAAGFADQATAYWLKAGQKALRRSANVEAMAHLGKGLELAASLPGSESHLRQEIHLQTAMGVALMAAKGWGAPEVLDVFSKAHALCEKLGDKNELFVALRGQASYHMISGNLAASAEIARQCFALGMDLAEASGDSGFFIEAHHQLWATNFYLGNYEVSEFHANQGIATYDPDLHHKLTYTYAGHDPGVCCRSNAAQVLWMRGRSDQALAHCRDAVALAERHGHPGSLVQAQMVSSYVHLLRREPDEGGQWAEKGFALASEFGLSLMIAQARVYRGWALADQGDAADGIKEMREGIAAIAATGADMGMAYYLCVLAQACGQDGLADEGLALVEKGLGILAKSNATYQLPELLRTKGELLARANSREDAAEPWFQQSLTMAHDEGAKTSELRAALGLARLYGTQGRNAEARDVLAPVYASFTEGFDTPDLLEAKALLQTIPHAN